MIQEKDLPKSYVEAMKELLGEEYPEYIATLHQRAFGGVRANTLKVSPEKMCELLKSDLRKVPWVETGFYTDENRGLSRSPYYYAGLYYIQEPSAMTPASVSQVRPGDRVLDLCAAPGGKSTQIAAKLQGEGVLVTNDLSNSRAKALLKNIEVSGVGNALITCEEPAKLANVYPEFFDAILVDAPCSGEGMFRRDNAVFQAYLKRGPEFFAPIQREILEEAAKMLRPGGHLVYSTCTYAKMEDEDTLCAFLEKHPEFSIDPLQMEKGFTESKILPGTIRLFPHKIDGEGHFVARLKKEGDTEHTTHHINQKKVKLPKEVEEFLHHIKRNWENERFYINREYVYYLPREAKLDRSLRYLRTGLLLGRINNKRFEPSQALAMNLKMQEWDNPVNLSIDDPQVLRYLKGETLEAQDEGSGYRLVCVEGYPLGFVKQDRMRLKNKYYPGWRMM